jgi:hypothetical protein
MLLSAAVAITLPKPSGIRTLVMTVILRLICSAGPQPTLMLLGTTTVVLKGVHLMSIMGNAETFQRSVRQICTDTKIVYHVIYLIFCSLYRASDSAPSSFPSFYLTSFTARRR